MGKWSRTSLVDEVEHLEFRLASVRNEAQRQTILTELTRKRPLASKLGDIRRARRIAFLGLGAWITHMLDVGKESEAGFKAREQILAPELSDLSVVYDVFSAVQNDDRWDRSVPLGPLGDPRMARILWCASSRMARAF